eukprot:371601-Pyramimonas_sp.AAC.1
MEYSHPTVVIDLKRLCDWVALRAYSLSIHLIGLSLPKVALRELSLAAPAPAAARPGMKSLSVTPLGGTPITQGGEVLPRSKSLQEKAATYPRYIHPSPSRDWSPPRGVVPSPRGIFPPPSRDWSPPRGIFPPTSRAERRLLLASLAI